MKDASAPKPVTDADQRLGMWASGADPDHLDHRLGEPAREPGHEPGPDEHDPHAPRTFLQKMFGINWFGWVKLFVLSAMVGALLQVANVNPFEPGFSWTYALTSLGRALANIGLWSLANGWQPALVGIVVVAPIWLVWRLLSAPFRH